MRVLILSSLLFLTGCGIVGGAMEWVGGTIETTGTWIKHDGAEASEQAGETIKSASGFLPPPWDSLAYGVGAFVAAMGGRKVYKKVKASKPGELLGKEGKG